MTGQDLVYAILLNDVDTVRSLLGAGADPNEVTTSPWARMTPLDAAASVKTDREILVLLLRAGAHFLSQSVPPGAWLKQEDEELIGLLEGAGILPFVAYAHNARPFIEAVESGAADDVARYLAAGIDPNLKTRNDDPVLHLARSPQVIRLLVESGADLEARGRLQDTALENACRGEFEAARTLIELGANVHATHDHGYSTLMLASGSVDRDPAILRLLLDHGADPRHSSDFGHNALHEAVAVFDGDATVDEVVRILVEAGTALEARTHRGLTPLLSAISYGSVEEALCLIRYGADPNARVLLPDGSGYRHSATPLMLANHSVEVVRALLATGADPSARDEEGRTALDYAEAELAQRQVPDEIARRLAAHWQAVMIDEEDGEDGQSIDPAAENASEAWERVTTYDGIVASVALLKSVAERG
ncbi:MAG: ankyrin repeat domain-containing protein [Fimbriimonas sp.]